METFEVVRVFVNKANTGHSSKIKNSATQKRENLIVKSSSTRRAHKTPSTAT